MSRHRPPPPATIESVAHEVAKLCRYVESLGRSAERLAGRIQPFENEKMMHDWDGLPQKVAPTLESMVKVIVAADERLRTIEYMVSYAKSAIDQISNDSWSRDELRPYLDNSKKPRT